MKINKNQLFEKFRAKIAIELQDALLAAQNTYDIATHEENKAENKYDTRGLEASYLAGAQAERVVDIRATLASFENIQPRDFGESDKVALTAVIEISSADKTQWLLLMPKGGGLVLQFAERTIQVVTPESPLGKALIGRSLGDSIEIKNKEYEVTALY